MLRAVTPKDTQGLNLGCPSCRYLQHEVVCLLPRHEGGMSPLATNQPPGGHPAPVTSAMLPWVLPSLLQSHREAGAPFPSPKFFFLWQGKASQMCPCSWLGLG